ncbi:MAG: ribosome silencing factor [Chitinispirillaceae bacterium]|nr:ribosome silencing factor [Chitinispirillaceae bacterium]
MKKIHGKSLGGTELVNRIIHALQEALAEAIVVIDLHGLPGAADHFIICQGDNTVHNRACADRVMERLALNGTRPWQHEGLDEGRWILLDYSDVVVHVMLPELRDYYNIEALWAGGVVRRIEHDEALSERSRIP